MSIRSGWSALALLVGALALASVPSAAGPPNRYPRWPSYFDQRARSAVVQPLYHQALNGLILDQTVWNHHFQYQTPAELHSSGVNLLDRLARRHVNSGIPGPLHIYLQTAVDSPYQPGKPGVVIQARQTFDHKRSEAVHAFLDATYPGLPFVVHVHNPPRVGLSPQETLTIITQMEQLAPRGYLTQEVLGGISLSELTKGGGGGLPMAPIANPTGTGGAGSFGADIGAGGAGGAGGDAGAGDAGPGR
jgi:hypothetical protein